MITITDLSKKIGKKTILRNINLTVAEGEIIALVGPNGAGKTTLISCLAGLQKPSSGKVTLWDQPSLSKKNKSSIGVMLQENTSLDNIKVKELLQLFASYHKQPMSVSDVLDLTDLHQQANTYTNKLSGGQKRRLTFGLAMIGNPELIVLDEPTTGMDVASRQIFWKKIQELAQTGKTILLTTHYLEEVEKVAQRILLMKDGQVIHDGTMASIQEDMLQHQIHFDTLQAPSLQQLQELPYVTAVHMDDHHVQLITQNSDETLLELLAEKITLKNLYIYPGNLETVFTNLLTEETI